MSDSLPATSNHGKRESDSFYSRHHGLGNREHSLPAPIYTTYISLSGTGNGKRGRAGTHPYVWGDMSPPHTRE